MLDFIIIAGCNGAGKSTFASSFLLDLKWNAGYKNANLYFRFFDNILFVDNSKQNDIYSNLLQIEKGEIVLMTEEIPDYFKHRFPDIFKLIKPE